MVRAREAITLIRPRSWSPMETVARLAIVRAGLPEPELNGEVKDAAGTWIATVDMVWREQRVIVEYDGAHHDGPEQRRRDITRRRQLRSEGWTVIEIAADDVLRWTDQLIELLRPLLAT